MLFNYSGDNLCSNFVQKGDVLCTWLRFVALRVSHEKDYLKARYQNASKFAKQMAKTKQPEKVKVFNRLHHVFSFICIFIHLTIFLDIIVFEPNFA